MIGRRIAIGAVLVLVGLLGTLGWLYRAELKESAQLAQTVLQQQATMDEMEQQLQEAEKMRRQAEKIAAEHRDRIEQITAEASDLRQKITNLEKENEEVRQWADTDIPDSVLDLLRGKDGDQN
ncbi:MAG: hypothetical protein ACOCUC_01870 [bacterium]